MNKKTARGSLRDLVSNQGAELFRMITASSTDTHQDAQGVC